MKINDIKNIDLNSLKVAIVHEWFVDYSGSERVVEQMLNLFPQADLYAQVDFLPDNLRGLIKNKKVTTSFIQKLPGARKHYRSYLPLMPLAVEQFDLSEYDLVLSSNHAVAKGVITGPDQIHISYVHSPIRYGWDLTHQYLSEANLKTGLKGWMAKIILHYMRIWDTRTANGVDKYLCNSNFIARRIKKVYRRKATVVHPPVDIDSFELERNKEDYYLAASRMVPYKKIGLIVDAFAKMPDKKLIVIGDGPDFNKIKARATDNVTMLGFQPTEILRKYMQKAKAFIFAAEEDFGIMPVEAQACGTPVIAYGKGGALETVVDGRTGLFFDRQEPEALIETIERFEQMDNLNPEKIREHALKFSVQNHSKALEEFIQQAVNEHFTSQHDLTDDFLFISDTIAKRGESVKMERVESINQ
jgi:glycosyltransferase involved in cell wall biosynthesis